MNDISGISSLHKITSRPKVSLESTQKTAPVEASTEVKAMQKFECEMEQINSAFALVKEIRHSLETALKNLSPN